MSWRYRACGFPLQRGYAFRYRGKRWRIKAPDVQSIKLLIRLVESRPDGVVDPCWLIPHRADFRSVLARVSRPALALVIERSRELPVRRLAIWLLGRAGGTTGTSTIAAAARSKNVVIRREAVRALKRKHAWSQLRTIAQRDPDARVRLLARQIRPHDYADRLSSYLGDVTPHDVVQTEPVLFVADDLASRPGRPPKSYHFIRYILERIRRLVHGSPREPC